MAGKERIKARRPNRNPAGKRLMYHSFSIKNFRCFDDLTLEGLGRINLIGGRNNIGKTALLEALWAHSGPTEPARVLPLAAGRGLVDPDNAIKNLFFGFDSSAVIELCARGDWGAAPRQLTICAEENPRIRLSGGGYGKDWPDFSPPDSQKRIVLDYRDESGETAVTKGWLARDADNARSLTIGYERKGPAAVGQGPTGAFLSPTNPRVSSQDIERYSRLEIAGQQDGVLQILQIVEPKLQRLTILATGTEPRIYADVGTKPLIPAQLMGAGMSRILTVALAIAGVPGGMVMVDEIENGLHYTVMEKVWQAVAAFARHYDVQLFATTHSHHCIQSACRAFAADEEEPLQLYSLAVRKGKISAARYDRERLEFAFEVGLGVI